MIAGPMMGDWLAQAAIEWMGDEGTLVSVSYSNRNFAIIGEVLHLAGEVSAIDPETGDVTLDLAILNAEDVVLTPGSAIVRLPLTE